MVRKGCLGFSSHPSWVLLAQWGALGTLGGLVIRYVYKVELKRSKVSFAGDRMAHRCL